MFVVLEESYPKMVHLRHSKPLSHVKTLNKPANTRPSRRQRIRYKNNTEQTSNEISKDSLDPPENRTPTTINDLPLEVLQHILSFVDCLALLKCRCVCTLWADCKPSNSSNLRRALFLPTVNTKSSDIQTLLYFEIFTTASTGHLRYSRARVLHIPRVRKVTLAFFTGCTDAHPLIRQVDRCLVAQIPNFDMIQSHAQLDDFHFDYVKNSFGDLLQPDSVPLLRGMLATNSPIICLHIKYRYMKVDSGEIEPRMERCSCSLEDSEGVSFGDLWHVVEVQLRGLLRLETMRRIDLRPEKYVYLAELREKVRDTICLV